MFRDDISISDETTILNKGKTNRIERSGRNIQEGSTKLKMPLFLNWEWIPKYLCYLALKPPYMLQMNFLIYQLNITKSDF